MKCLFLGICSVVVVLVSVQLMRSAEIWMTIIMSFIWKASLFLGNPVLAIMI